MNYSLGNMLNGGDSLNADGLALDLQFATDKTLTARKGPTPVFTRASGATQVGASGLIEFAPENLVLQSEQVNASPWTNTSVTVTANNAVSPAGTTTADEVIFATGGSIIQNVSIGLVGLTTTFSIYVKQSVGSGFYRIAVGDSTAPSNFFGGWFNTLTGLWATTSVSGNGVLVSSSSTNVGNGWYRISITGSIPTATSYFPFMYITDSDNITIRSSTVSQYWWGVQLERFSTARTYIPTTTAVVYGARFDHDPITLACKGLLIEESRTNLLLQNQAFGTTWTTQQLNTTGTPAYLNVATAPDGTTTADKLIATAALTTHQFRQSVTLVSGTAYSLTCYFKAAEQQFASIAAFGVANGNADWVSLFNISSSPSTGTFNGFTSTSVTNAGNGWIRCTAIFTATTSGSLEIRLGGASGTSGITPQIYTGDGTSGIFLWGAQLEAGAFPTSYIPTTTASVVRSVDICSITGANFTSFYNQPEGTIFTDSYPAAVAGTVTTFGLSNGTANERWLNRFAQNEQVVITSAGTESGLDAINPVAGQRIKVAAAAKLNDFAMSINGLAVVTDSSQPMPVVDRAGIGNAIGTSTTGAVTIASIRYYKKRLANAKLVTLTA